MRPPLAAETIVAGMIADRNVQDLVLGDCAEEWRDRAEIDGPRDADRWYWRETLRTAPHLVRLWWRESPWYRIAAVACTAIVARILTLILGNAGIVFLIVATALAHRYWEFPADQVEVQAINFLKNAAIIGGMIYVFVHGPGRFSGDAMMSQR
jgi:hypothetical protein